MKLKSQNDYRRLRKPFIFILSIILTLSICSLEGFKKPYRADTYYKGYTTQYGSYSLVETNLFGNTRVQSLFMYAFNGVYNGRIRIYYTTSSYNGTDSILPINCTIESRSDSYLQVTFKNVSEICIIFQNANLNPIDITSVTYPGDNAMTKITNGTNNQLETIETILYNIQTTNQTIATNTNGIATTNTQLTTLNNNVNSILTQISSYFTTNNGTTINIGDIILQFNEFNAQLQLQLGILNDLKSALLDIDNKIDTITWNNVTVKGLTTDLSSFTNPYSAQRLTDTQYIAFGMINFNNSLLSQTPIFKLTIPSYPSVNGNTINIYGGTTVNNKTIVSEYDILFKNIGRRTIDIYFKPTLNSPIAGNAYLFFNAPDLYVYSDTPTLTWIGQNDIEYWNLYNIFTRLQNIDTIINKLNELKPYNYNSKLDDIINAIDGLNMSVTNTTVNDTQINIDNYNDIMTDIENIEINFNTQFNNNSNAITSDKISAPTFNDEKRLLTKVANELIISNSKMKYIIYIILLGIVVIRILG